MPYYRKVKKKINGKWYPQSVTVGDPVTTDEIAQLLADFSSASVGDTYNILKNLARAMSIYMSNGRTVKLQINGVRVRYLPEYTRSADHSATRAIVPDSLKWEEWGGDTSSSSSSTTPGTGGGTDDTGSDGSFG